MTAASDDVIELGTVARILWLAKWRLLAWLVGGGAIAGAALLVIPRKWEARATVVARSSEGSPGGLSRSGLTDLVSSAVLGGAGTRMESELELLRSRRLRREVAELLPLGIEVRSPAGLPSTAVVRAFAPNGRFERRTLTIVPTGQGWRVRGDGLDTTVAAGATIVLPEGTLTLATPSPTDSRVVTVRLLDDQLLQKRLDRRVTLARAGGDIASVTTRWEDSLTGSLIANALVDRYVSWRRENDSGDNATLLALVTRQADSVERALTVALNALRMLEESSGVIEPRATAEVLADRLTRLQAEGRTARVEQASLDTPIAGLASDRTRGGVRRLPTFPAFLVSPAIADLLGQVTRLESERTALLETRTENDPTVRGRAAAVAQIEAQILPLASTYRATVAERERVLLASTDSLQRLLAALPRVGREYTELSLEVKRLGDIGTALRVQALQLRIATHNAGGGARQVDVAVPTRLPTWPVPWIVFLIGALGATACGTMRELLLAPRVTPRHTPKRIPANDVT